MPQLRDCEQGWGTAAKEDGGEGLLIIDLSGNFCCQAIEIKLDITRTRARMAISDDKDGKVAVIAPPPTERNVNVGSSWQQGNNYLSTLSTSRGEDAMCLYTIVHEGDKPIGCKRIARTHPNVFSRYHD